MEKLNFVFKDGLKKVYDISTNYKFLNGYYVFKTENSLFKVKIDGGFHFIKTDDDSTFSLKDDEGKIECQVTFKIDGKDLKYDIKVLKFECKKTEKMATIKYLLESDEDREKSIFLSIV